MEAVDGFLLCVLCPSVCAARVYTYMSGACVRVHARASGFFQRSSHPSPGGLLWAGREVVHFPNALPGAKGTLCPKKWRFQKKLVWLAKPGPKLNPLGGCLLWVGALWAPPRVGKNRNLACIYVWFVFMSVCARVCVCVYLHVCILWVCVCLSLFF